MPARHNVLYCGGGKTDYSQERKNTLLMLNFLNIYTSSGVKHRGPNTDAVINVINTTDL